MTPERMAELVTRWARFYTRDLPTPIAQRRIDEIDADLHDHIGHERARGTSDRRIALSILSRMVRGLAADTSWRGQHAKATSVSRSAVGVVLATALVLLVPLVAMQFTDEVVWDLADFAFAGALLAGTGLMLQAAWRRARSNAYRLAAAVALGAVLLLVWSAAAVGVIGEDGDPADLMYGAVLAVGIIGAVIARYQPAGMARALLAMALVQALIAVIALLAGKHQAPVSSVFEILGLNGFFVALFIGSAWLFRHAARRQSPEERPW
jgi:hypothetical protein